MRESIYGRPREGAGVVSEVRPCSVAPPTVPVLPPRHRSDITSCRRTVRGDSLSSSSCEGHMIRRLFSAWLDFDNQPLVFRACAPLILLVVVGAVTILVEELVWGLPL